jgi:predicted nucleic acid-binding protein
MAAVVFDATYLVPLLDSRVKGVSDDPRVNYLFETLEKSKAKIIIPTPALSEVLIGAGDAAPKYLEIITRSARFKVVPFGDRAAVEAADAHRRAINAGDKREGADTTWAKVKYDRQIMAIAKVENADCVYSNDDDLVRMGQKDGIPVVTLTQLPNPPAPASIDQYSMFGRVLDLDLEVKPIEPPPPDRPRQIDLDVPPIDDLPALPDQSRKIDLP